MRGKKSDRLRVTDVRAIYRLVGECRELGSDPSAWRRHLARSVGPLVGGQLGMSGESAKPSDGRTPGLVYHCVDYGWTVPEDREVWASYLASGGYMHDSTLPAIQAFGLRHGLCARQQAVDDATWFGSHYYNEVQSLCGLDEFLISFQDLPGRTRHNLLTVLRPKSGGVFRRRERRLLQLLHSELGCHFGASLVTLDDPNPSGLTPRLRETLRCLLEGDSEKQVAARLGLSPTTVHEYVKAVYRHFRVSSRPELMAYFLRRSGFRLS